MKISKPYPDKFESVIILVIFFAVQFIIGGALTIILLILDMLENSTMLLVLISNIFAFSVTMIFIKHSSNIRIRDVFTIKMPDFISILAFVIFLLGLQIIVSELTNIAFYFIKLPDIIIRLLENQQKLRPDIMSFLCLVVMASLTEEIIFRGTIMTGLLKNYGFKTGLFISSLFFALLHLSPLLIPSTFILGLVFGLVFLRTRSLLTSIIAHSYNNLLALTIVFLGEMNIDGFSNSLSGPIEFHPLWVDILGIISLIVGILLLRKIYLNLLPVQFKTYCSLEEHEEVPEPDLLN